MYIWNRKKCIFNLGKTKKPFISGNIMKFSWKERKVICIKCRYILFWNKKKKIHSVFLSPFVLKAKKVKKKKIIGKIKKGYITEKSQEKSYIHQPNTHERDNVFVTYVDMVFMILKKWMLAALEASYIAFLLGRVDVHMYI